MARVLIVEDDEQLGQVVLTHLQARGFDVTWAKTVAQARACYKGARFNLILCDYELPDGTGLDFLEDVADIPHRQPYTILWSGIDRTREVQQRAVWPDVIETKDRLPEVLDLVEGEAAAA